MRAQIVSALQQFHARMPDELGPDAARLRRIAAPLLPEALWRALIDALIAEGVVVRSGAWLHLPEHTVSLDASEEVLAAKLLPLIAQGRFDPPWVRDLASSTQESEERVRQLLRKLARRGEVYQIVRDLFYHPDGVRELAGLVAGAGARSRWRGGGVCVPRRERSGPQTCDPDFGVLRPRWVYSVSA